MRRKAKIAAFAVAGLAVVLLGFWIYQRPYRIENDNSNLQEELLQFYNRGSLVFQELPLTVYDTVTVGKTRYVVFTLGVEEAMGHALLLQGLNGRWRINSMGYGSSNFRDDILEINGAHYLFFSGRNTGHMIDRVTAELENILYELDIPDQDCFLVSTEVEIFEEENHILPENFHFYDAAGQEITANIRWN